jgi:hypothetical protein
MSVLPELRAAFFVDWKQSDAIERRANGAVGNENMRVFALEDPSLKQGFCNFQFRFLMI